MADMKAPMPAEGTADRRRSHRVNIAMPIPSSAAALEARNGSRNNLRPCPSARTAAICG